MANVERIISTQGLEKALGLYMSISWHVDWHCYRGGILYAAISYSFGRHSVSESLAT